MDDNRTDYKRQHSRESSSSVGAETGRARWGEILDAEKMKKCVWVRPKLVAVIEFLEWTEGDRLRHSKFIALREDKDPREVVKGSVTLPW